MSQREQSSFVAGVDGCRCGWIAFKVALSNLSTGIELFDLPFVLKAKPAELAVLAIDIPIGLLDGSRPCDKAARKLLDQPRGTSVFAAPCRASLSQKNHSDASAINTRITGRGLSQQAWGIAPKIKQVDDAMTADCQQWVFEVHPEVSFWALNDCAPMRHNKKSEEGATERLTLLQTVFPDVGRHLENRPSDVGKDDMLDAAVAAWTALRIHNGEARQVCEPERDHKGLEATIWY